MRRVLPMMFFSIAVVAMAVFHAHRDTSEDFAYLVPAAAPIVVETLTQ